MAINFPSSPVTSDVFLLGGVSYVWSGSSWDASVASGPTGPLPDLGALEGDLVPASDVVFDLGSSDFRWRDLYLSGSSIYLGDAVLSSSDGVLDVSVGGAEPVRFLTASDSSSFATAAQGSLADSAVQPSDSIVVGDGGTIGSVSDPDALSIASNGTVLASQSISSPIYRSAYTNVAGTATITNYFKLGTIVINDSYGAHIKILGARSYSAGANTAGITHIILRGNNSSTSLDGYFYGETMGSNTVTNVAYVNTAADTFDIYIKYNNTYGGLDFIVEGSQSFVVDVSDTGSASAPGSSAALPSRNTITVDGVSVATFNSNGIALPAGKGIDFSANGNAAGMTSELLDDYEEGTWTPQFEFDTSGSATMNSATTGKYIKIGQICTVFALCQTSSISSPSGNLNITGLPFSVSAEVGFNLRTGGAIGELYRWNTNMPDFRLEAIGNRDSIRAWKMATNATSASFVVGSDLATGVGYNSLTFSLTYKTA